MGKAAKARKKVQRVLFNEITKQAVEEALQEPGDIDKKLDDAQQARRVLDRLVGYKVSPLLWNKVRRGLSAGRVQSVALQLICEREREIRAFVPEEYWSVEAHLAAARRRRSPARLAEMNGQKLDITNAEQADAIRKDLEAAAFRVDKVEAQERRRNPAPPFITSQAPAGAVAQARLPA